MSEKREFTVIVPTWNFARFMRPLYDSIVKTEFIDSVKEIIFVCERSEEVIQQIIDQEQGKEYSVSLIVPERRRGLFFARLIGAEAATTKKIMFIDSRIQLDPSVGKALATIGKEYNALSGYVKIDTSKNIFSLYWQRSHETVFAKTFANYDKVQKVTSENFDEVRTGGTCFFCLRDLFVEVSKKYEKLELKSDDTYVMKEMVKTEPFHIHPDYWVWWEPRDEWWSFLTHLYYRGPGFAEYHLYEKRGWLFCAVVLGVVFLLTTFATLFISPILFLGIVGSGILAVALSTFVISKGIVEGFRLMPLHVGVIMAYGFGALRGAWVVYRKRQRLRYADTF